MILLFLILLLSHFIGDFIVQSKELIELKGKDDKICKIFNKGLFIHSIYHFGTSIILVFIFKQVNLVSLLAVVLVSVVHYGVDWLKTRGESSKWLDRKLPGTKNSTIFLLDQLLHIVSIYLILYMFNIVGNIKIIIEQLNIFLFATNLTMETEIKIISLLLITIILTNGSSYFIVAFLKDIAPKKSEENKQEAAASLENIIEDLPLHKFKGQVENTNVDMVFENSYQVSVESEKDNKVIQSVKVQYNKYRTSNSISTGKYIGILERILISLFIISNMYQGLLLIGAIKTLTRFKQFDDRDFAEYYLFGTLLSLVFGLLCGWCISRILT